MSAGSSNHGAANLRSAATVVVPVRPFTCQPLSSSRPSNVAVVPAILSPLPLNVVTPVSVRISAATRMSMRAGGPAACP